MCVLFYRSVVAGALIESGPGCRPLVAELGAACGSERVCVCVCVSVCVCSVLSLSCRWRVD